MREMDKDGLLLCEIQAKVFEKSIEQEQCSSGIFVRRYMNSKVCERICALDSYCPVLPNYLYSSLQRRMNCL